MRIRRHVRDLTESEFGKLLTGPGLAIRLGPFNAHYLVGAEEIHGDLYRLYRDYPLLDDNPVYSFRADLKPRRAIPRLYRRLVRFSVDGIVPHEDMPREHALPVLEWGVNLVIAMRSHCFLLLHSAVLDLDGHAMLLPAAPGAGKTTLCAALAHSGWRLMSDEFGMVRPGELAFHSLPRPMPLKNGSISVIREFAEGARFGPVVAGTKKGTVVHVAPPTESVANQERKSTVRWIVFPYWHPGAKLTLEPLSMPECFMNLAMNAFNYELLGEPAYRTVADIMAAAKGYRLVYSDLGEATKRLLALAKAHE